MLESIPHSWLFPKMAAVIHHGGAGTTTAGFRAGVPSIIIPFANDQFGWDLRAYELGVGSKSIPRKELTVEKLVVAINYVLKDEIKNKAYLLGQNIQKEDGVKNATKIIMSCL